MTAPQILSRAALPSLIQSLDASDVLECYHLTRHAPLHLNLTAPAPILIPKSAIGLRYISGKKQEMELTLEYGPQRLGSDQQEEAIPVLQETYVSWQNEAKIYYNTQFEPERWESAHYMASITGVVLEKLLQKAVDYPRKRYQPFVVLLGDKVVLKSSSDSDFIRFVWEALATYGVSLQPLLPPRLYEARLHVSEISKLASGAMSVEHNYSMTVAQEAFSFIQTLQACVKSIATEQDPPTNEPTSMPSSTMLMEPTSMPSHTMYPTTMPSSSSSTMLEPTTMPSSTTSMEPSGANDITVVDDNDNLVDGNDDTGKDDNTDNDANKDLNGDNANDKDDDQADSDGNADDKDQNGSTRFRLLSSWQQYLFPESVEVREIEDGADAAVDDYSYNETTTDIMDNATSPPNEAQEANEAAQEAKEAAEEAKEAATTAADTKAADAAEAAANAAQKAANVTLQKQKQVAQQNLLSGDGDAMSLSLRECFTNPQYQLSRNGTTVGYLYLDGATYYRLNLTMPYLSVALVESPIPLPLKFATSGSGGGDFVDWTLTLGTIGFMIAFLMLMLQRAGFRFLRPLYMMQKWFFSPIESFDSYECDQENENIGRGFEHAFGEDVIPLSMGGRRPNGRARKLGARVFMESVDDDHQGDVEMVDKVKTPRRSPDSSGHNLGFGFGPIIMDLPDRLAKDPDLVDLPNLSSGSKVAVPVSIQHQRGRTLSRELGDLSDDDSVPDKCS